MTIIGQKKTHLLWKHPTSYSSVTSFAAQLYLYISYSKEKGNWNDHETVLTWWPWPLTYDLDLDVFPLDLPAEIQVRTSVHSAFIVRRTDGHKHRQTHDAKTITPDTSETWGVKMLHGCNRLFVMEITEEIRQVWYPYSITDNYNEALW